MDKQTQDIAWRCLPKDARKEIRAEYQNAIEGSDLEDFLIDFFGHHNLTSDTEPEEMLMVEKREVQRVYAEFPLRNTIAPDQAVKLSLNILFGDKCLPDKIQDAGFGGMSLTPPAYKLDVETDKELEHRLEQSSVQVEPMKFFKSDYCIGDKVIIAISSIGNPRKEVVTLLRQYQPQCEYNEYTKTWVVQTQTGMTYQSNEEHFEPYTDPETKDAYEQYQDAKAEEYDNQLKDAMEEKELNRKALYDALCELESASGKVRKALISLG